RPEKINDGLGYNAVPPPVADLYLSPKKDWSWTGLPEFADDTVTDYSRPSPTRVQRLERELKARTPKVDRGRSRPIMAWVPKRD
nr:hypothetical protein [Tanacetum cinerariifolium]